MQLEFWFDVVCPYAYLASTRVQPLAARAGAQLVYKPVLLGGLYKAHRSASNPAAVMSAPRARLDLLDRTRQAMGFGVPLALNPGHPVRSVAAMRLVLAAADKAPAVARDLFRAYHVDGEDISDAALLDRTAIRHGLEPGCYRAAAVKAALFDAVDEGVAKGVFGVPAFFVDDGPLIWGADQLHFVAEQLGLGRAVTARTSRSGASLAFFHDFSSPYSYLASTRVRAIAERHAAVLEHVPILLGGLFRELGGPDVPLESFSKAKRRWNHDNLKRWAAWWGVPFRFASRFPIRTVAPLRVSIAEPASIDVLYRAAWADDLDIGQPEVLRRVLDDAGFDGASLLERAADPAIKAQLRANTERARAAGCCGVPSMLVGGDQLFWGQDRLEMVEDALARA